ncbi:MAG: energy transducer TonB, partial [Methylotenera sp.]
MAKPINKKKLSVLDSLVVKLKTMSVMAVAIWVSILVHVVLLSIHFEPELKKFRDNLPTLEVMLVNS